jgi:plastocyanin
MRISRLFLPLLALLIIGSGCALSSADTKREVALVPVEEEQKAAELKTADVEVQVEDARPVMVSAEVGVEVSPVVRNILLKDGDFYFDPTVMEAERGEVFTVTFSDSHTGKHTFNIDELDIHEEIVPGKTITITAPALPGRYAYYCNVGPHRTLGMEGILIVE